MPNLRDDPPSLAEAIETNGFAVLPRVLTDPAVHGLERFLADALPLNIAGYRCLLDHPEIQDLAVVMADVVIRAVRGSWFAVRGIYFDKSNDSNWAAPWHQDLTVAVESKLEVPGYTKWSMKDGLPHVQPPIHILEQMIILRLHLDPCDQYSGALRVLQGTHTVGRIPHRAMSSWRARAAEIICPVAAGGAMLMRPLLLHSSTKSIQPTHRRVIHLEYATTELDGGLRWRHQWPRVNTPVSTNVVS